MKLYWRSTERKTVHVGYIMLGGIETDVMYIRYLPEDEDRDIPKWRMYPAMQPFNYTDYAAASKIRSLKGVAKSWAEDHLSAIVSEMLDGIQLKLG